MRETSERIGVIVIHGVGETAAGWSSEFLLPRLEQWLARKNAKIPYRSEADPLSLRLRTADQDVTILVDDNPAFAALCECLRVPDLVEQREFSSVERRSRYRDQLIEALEAVVAGSSSFDLVAKLTQAGLPATQTFDRVAHVHKVRDPASSNPTRTWTSYSHNWTMGHRHVAFSELFWADMSKVGYTIPTRLLALVQLFLESPYILGNAFLRGGKGPHFVALRWLILAVNWLMRWPIAGLNVAIFAPALLAIIYLEVAKIFGVDGSEWLGAFVASTFVVNGFIGLRSHERLMHRQVGLSDLSLAGAICSMVLLGILLAAALIAPVAELQRPENYLLLGVVLLLVVWFLWSLTTVFAVLLISSIALKRLLVRPGAGAVSLARPSAALSLSLLLGVLWKFVLALLGLFVITLLVPDLAQSAGESCAATTLRQMLIEAVPRLCALTQVRSLLLAVTAMNAIAIILIAVAVGLIYATRAVIKTLSATAAREGTLRLPRVIASPLLIATLFAGAVINFFAFYTVLYEDLELAQQVRELITRNDATATVPAATLGLLAFIFVLQRVIEFSNNFVHIGRDLVDHQYDPPARAHAPSGGAGSQVPKTAQFPPLKFLDAPGATAKSTGYRRRQRIQRRLEALIDSVVARSNVDRLIFVAHSQGTVIMHDYLADQDGLTRRGERTNEMFRTLQSLDLITVGSPLKHLYRYYFSDYDRTYVVNPATEHLMSRVRSWTNLWRVDDPIGQDVDLHPEIQNVGLPPGGHVDYWREDRFCGELWQRILNTPENNAHGTEIDMPRNFQGSFS